MTDGYSNKYIDLINEVKIAKKVFVYVGFVDEYIRVQKGDFWDTLISGYDTGYDMESETGWQWDKTDASIFIN